MIILKCVTLPCVLRIVLNDYLNLWISVSVIRRNLLRNGCLIVSDLLSSSWALADDYLREAILLENKISNKWTRLYAFFGPLSDKPFYQLIECIDDSHAMREFLAYLSSQASDKDCYPPSDFQLVQVGAFNFIEGVLHRYNQPHIVASGSVVFSNYVNSTLCEIDLDTFEGEVTRLKA